MIIIGFCVLEFQRKVMEMLVEIREDIRTLKKSVGDAEMHTVSKIPAQSSTVEELNILDKSLNCLDEKLRLVRLYLFISVMP